MNISTEEAKNIRSALDTAIAELQEVDNPTTGERALLQDAVMVRTQINFHIQQAAQHS